MGLGARRCGELEAPEELAQVTPEALEESEVAASADETAPTFVDFLLVYVLRCLRMLIVWSVGDHAMLVWVGGETKSLSLAPCHFPRLSQNGPSVYVAA